MVTGAVGASDHRLIVASMVSRRCTQAISDLAYGIPGEGLVGREGGDSCDIEVGRDRGCRIDGLRSSRNGAAPG